MLIFTCWEEFQNWKKDKVWKDWSSQQVAFKCVKCNNIITIRAQNFQRDFICRPCRKSDTESKKTKIKKKKKPRKENKLL